MNKIPVASPSLGKDEWNNLKKCLESTWISSNGPYIDEFEKNFAKFCGTKYAITVNNGTSALHLALLAFGIHSGDEVIVPALTFVSTANAVIYCGATIVFADIDPTTWTMDLEQVKNRITNKTKAIIPVHLYGYPVDMAGLKKIAKKHKIAIIEDAAEAHGAKYSNNMVGSIGDVGCFSFYGNKIITTGEGGMITLNDKKTAENILLLKNHGTSGKKRYYHEVVGYNYRLTNLQAAVGLAQLKKIKYFLKKRNSIDNLYRKNLKGIKGIALPPKKTKIYDPVCWLFSIVIKDDFPLTRNQLMDYLAKNSVETRPFFIPLPALPMYREQRQYPIATMIAQGGLNLPTSIDMTEEQICYIAELIKKASI